MAGLKKLIEWNLKLALHTYHGFPDEIHGETNITVARKVELAAENTFYGNHNKPARGVHTRTPLHMKRPVNENANYAMNGNLGSLKRMLSKHGFGHFVRKALTAHASPCTLISDVGDVISSISIPNNCIAINDVRRTAVQIAMFFGCPLRKSPCKIIVMITLK